MGKAKFQQKSSFHLQGVLQQWVAEPGHRPKQLWIATAEGEYLVKLAQSARMGLRQLPQPGDRIQLAGERKIDLLTGKTKLKADVLQLLGGDCSAASSPCSPSQANLKAKAKVLVCQKSSCQKRGAQAVQQAIAATLAQQELADQVVVKATGCMGCCKKGPAVVFMPDKAHYHRVTPTEIPTLVSEHIAAKFAADPTTAPEITSAVAFTLSTLAD